MDEPKLSIKDDPDRIMDYNDTIVPWLRQQNLSDEIVPFLETGNLADDCFTLDLEDIDGSLALLASSPEVTALFKDKKRLFELAELLICEELHEMAVQVIKHLRSTIFLSSTLALLIGSLARKRLVVFRQILYLWYPKVVDLLHALQNMVHLRMGEDSVIEFFDKVWDSVFEALSKQIEREQVERRYMYGVYHQLEGILLTAMGVHYVSVFEFILERVPGLITRINKGMKHGNTIVHCFARNPAPETINNIPAYRLAPDGHSIIRLRDSRVNMDDIDWGNVPSCHLRRSYPEANRDLLAAMVKHGALLDVSNSRHMTPLHAAIIFKNAPIVKVLLEAGAYNPFSIKRFTIHDVFREYYSEEVEAVLVDFGKRLSTSSGSNKA